jgi:hypothetical protein
MLTRKKIKKILDTKAYQPPSLADLEELCILAIRVFDLEDGLREIKDRASGEDSWLSRLIDITQICNSLELEDEKNG